MLKKAEVKNARKLSANTHLRKARSDRKWTQQELADRIGTTKINISRWENGVTFPSRYSRQRLSEVFGKTPDELGLSQTSLPVPRIWNVPIIRSAYFTGREDLLALLHKRLSTTRAAALTQPQALYGLGGIGKTQTAAEYAFRYREEYTHVFWMRAASRETLAADFVTLAELLDLPEKGEKDQLRVIAAVKRWLASQEGWLLILDNADDLRQTQEFLPPSHQGYVIFTTRAQAAGPIAASVAVEQLSPEDGALLLLRWTKRLEMDAPLEQAQVEDYVDALLIVREMEGLPLAIVQAGAYIEETGCSLEDYLQLYTTHRKELLERRSDLVLDYPETVATTWSLSFRKIEQQSPASAELLRLCAFLAPDVIPEALLRQGAAELGKVLGPVARDSYKLNEALEVLRRYSLVRRDAKTHTLTIHRLVQIVLKDNMGEEGQRIWAERAVRAVNVAFPEADHGAGAHQSFLQDYLPHVQECAAFIERYQLHFPEAARLLYQAGAFLYFHGFYPQSQALHRQALTIREQAFGALDPSVAESFNALAVLARLQGDYGQAEAFHRQALAIREQVLGPEHPTTALSLSNLGVLYLGQGKYEQAEPLLQQALSISKQERGSEHLDTLMSILNLAKLYGEQSKDEQAEQMLKEALATSERVFEPEHPLIAHNLNLLARLSYTRGDYKQAETLWKRSLSILEKKLGPEHPSTADRLNDLAELAFAQGRYEQAQSLCQRALSICEKTFGPEHPDTIAHRELLSRIVSKMEAEQDTQHPVLPPS